MTAPSIVQFIDHTLLRPDATVSDIETLCDEAIRYGFVAVCVNPWHVARSSDRLKGSDVEVCTVIGFPLGANTTAIKVAEARQAIADGADELDMVLSIGALKAGDDAFVEEDIAAVVQVSECRIVKVILETGLLTNDEKVRAARRVRAAGAQFVKTCTGFSEGGATVEDVRLLKQTVGPDLGVKASGKVRDLATAMAMIEAGATRIGTSSGVKIAEEEKAAR